MKEREKGRGGGGKTVAKFVAARWLRARRLFHETDRVSTVPNENRERERERERRKRGIKKKKDRLTDG